MEAVHGTPSRSSDHSALIDGSEAPRFLRSFTLGSKSETESPGDVQTEAPVTTALQCVLKANIAYCIETSNFKFEQTSLNQI